MLLVLPLKVLKALQAQPQTPLMLRDLPEHFHRLVGPWALDEAANGMHASKYGVESLLK